MGTGEGTQRRLVAELNWIVSAQHQLADRLPEGAPNATIGRPTRTWWEGGLAVHPPNWAESGVEEFMYCQQQLLVEDADLPRVHEALASAGLSAELVDSLFGGVSLLAVDDSVIDVIALLDDRLGVGVATPNHVLGISPVAGRCPATEPDEPGTADPWPAVRDDDAGQGVRVAVVDTGFLGGWETRQDLPWLEGITEYDVENPDILPPHGYIDPYAGHGTFIAGVVRCIARGAEVTVDRTVDLAGVVDEASLVRQIGDALARSPDVISLSAGGYTRKNLPPKSFAALWEHRLRHHKGVALVAAAGNNDTRQPFWPAAFPWAVSVGALTADGQRRAEFSNYGGWVDVYAPGVDIVNAYCEGEYRLLLNPDVVRTFKGMCKWSGTSFSTPMATGLIAARMSRTGENARQAADALLEAARGQFLPGVGPRLLP